VGERDGYRLNGFDLGNSPTRVHTVDWQGRTAILTTTNGTSGLAAARDTDQVLTGSFVNAGAIIRHIRHLSVANVSLICMGSAGRPALEDSLCGQYLQEVLTGKTPDFQAMKAQIMKSPEAARFLDDRHSEDLPPRDLTFCLDLNRFDFALQAQEVCNGVFELNRAGTH
jgi:2-phosphosulfolactate phosphatase